MTEKELILKIRELKQITPRKEWVFLTKKEILGKSEAQPEVSWIEVFSRFFFQYKLALAGLGLIVVVVLTLGFSQNALPGDLLFVFKKATETAQTAFLSQDEQLKTRLELANKRLEELNKIAEQNQARKLAPAIEEYQASVSQAAKLAAGIKKAEEARKLVPEIKKLESNLQNLKSYGVEIGDTENTENIYKSIVEVLIKDLDTRTLTEEQQEILTEAKASYESGDYSNALYTLLQIQPAND